MSDQPSSWAAGWAAFAGILLVIAGCFHAMVGVIELVDKDFVAVTSNWAFKFNITTWGWLHIVIGVLLLLSGIGIFSGNVLARTVGVILALISAIAVFAWLPYYPVWAVVILVIDVSIIWALTAHGRDLADSRT